MSEGTVAASAPVRERRDSPALSAAKHIILVALLGGMYRRSGWELYQNWTMVDSYYTHGFLVPVISLFFVWKRRRDLAATPAKPCVWGYAWVVGAGVLLLLGDFLGFRVFGQFSFIPMLTGVLLLIHGVGRTKLIWFPLAFLIFMVPIPPSLTQALALRIKLGATESAVIVAKALTLPMVRQGSFIHFGNDHLLIGEVCGGLRSLIALLAFGSLMAYVSKCRAWARVVLLAMSAPIAFVANILRILVLCLVGYFWGSDAAAGWVHDVSGILIFVVAFVLFFALEALLRRRAPQHEVREGVA